MKRVILVLFLGALIGVSSCKKDEIEPVSAGQTHAINTKADFYVDTNSTDIDYIESKIEWFEKVVLKEGKDVSMPVEYAVWYWENYINLRYAYAEKGGNSVNVRIKRLDVDLSDGKVNTPTLQLITKKALGITQEQFNSLNAPKNKHLQSVCFDGITIKDGAAYVRYTSAINYDDGNIYKASDNPFHEGDDWYWGMGLGRYPNHEDEPEDASTQINHYALVHYGLENGYEGPIFLGIIYWTDNELYWNKHPYHLNDYPQPHLTYTEMNYWYNKFIDDIQLYIDNSNATTVVDLYYWYFGQDGYENPNGGFAEHLGKVELASPIHLPEAIANRRYALFME